MDDKIHDCNTQLTSINKKNETLRGDLQHLDLLFNITFQKYINQLNGTQQIVLLDKKSSSKPVKIKTIIISSYYYIKVRQHANRQIIIFFYLDLVRISNWIYYKSYYYCTLISK